MAFNLGGPGGSGASAATQHTPQSATHLTGQPHTDKLRDHYLLSAHHFQTKCQFEGFIQLSQHHWTRTSLLLIVAYPLLGARALPELVLWIIDNCPLQPNFNWIQIKIQQIYFQSRKCIWIYCLQNFDHFVPTPDQSKAPFSNVF